MNELRDQRIRLETRIKREMDALEQSRTKMDETKYALDAIEQNLKGHNEQLKEFAVRLNVPLRRLTPKHTLSP